MQPGGHAGGEGSAREAPAQPQRVYHAPCAPPYALRRCKFSHDLTVERKGAKIDLFTDQRDIKGEGAEGESQEVGLWVGACGCAGAGAKGAWDLRTSRDMQGRMSTQVEPHW